MVHCEGHTSQLSSANTISTISLARYVQQFSAHKIVTTSTMDKFTATTIIRHDSRNDVTDAKQQS